MMNLTTLVPPRIHICFIMNPQLISRIVLNITVLKKLILLKILTVGVVTKY